ncbi:MAG TPA: beta-ketoacyl-[acyl-carrier-protein] synthase family protein, partial [Pseudonocardiaceae bacterium]
RKVVVTGTGAVSPAGTDSESHALGLMAGWPTCEALGGGFEEFEHAIGCRVASVDHADNAMPRYVRLGLPAAREAVEHAGLSARERAETDVVAATAISAIVELESAHRSGVAPPAGWFGFDLLTERVRAELGIGGRSLTVSTGCTTALDALGAAVDAIASGRSSRVLVAAGEAALTRAVVAGFQRVGALSTRRGPPERASCPFSSERDGFVLGEGGAAVIVEDADLAAARGVRPAMEVCGWGSVSSAYHMTGIRKTGEDIARSVRQALDNADLPADAIDCIDAHGSSTPLNDASEAAAFSDVFGDRLASMPVVAQKGMLGHALGASNLLEVVGLAGLLPKGVLPPVKNTSRETLSEPVDLVMDEPRHMQPEYVIKTSSGFSGLHSACVLRVIS